MRDYFIRTERIGFSKWSVEDIALAKSLWGEKAVTRLICAGGKFTEHEILQRLGREIENGRKFGVQYWPVFCLKSGELIGCCGLRPYGGEKDCYELGYHLREKFWRKGLATEAAQAAVEYAAVVLKAESLLAGHHPENAASKKVLEKLGFRYEGNQYYAPTGLYHPFYRCRLRTE